MILKKLELSGFKSFAGKTVLEFPARVVAIVGPNGSGKSNVIDAIRWLLGERDAKNLRGGRIEDLIFAGTPGKPRAGMAQSSLFFDNSSGFFPVDFSEVSIMRQVNRDGDSKYFLNNTEVRLKDLVDFLAKSRLGSKGLTIIGQGNSDLFIKATPEERRFMIEEILGLREYQIKKTDASKKLGTIAINLDKTRALVEEIKPHLRVLKRQAEKWEQRGNIEKELYDLECRFFGAKLMEIEKATSAFHPDLKKLDESISAFRQELKKLEEEFSKIENKAPSQKAETDGIKQKKNELLQKRASLQRELGRLDAQLEILERSQKQEQAVIDPEKAFSLIKKIRKELGAFLALGGDELREKIGLLVREIDAVFEAPRANPNVEEVARLKELNRGAIATLASLDNELELLERREAELTSELTGFNEVFKSAIGVLEAKKQDIARLESEKNKLSFEKERFDLRQNDIMLQLQERELNAVQVVADFKNRLAAESGAGEGDSERRIMRLRGELAGIGEIDEALLKEYRDTDARYQFLTAQSEDLDKAAIDLQNLVKELDEKIHVEFAKSLKNINEEFDKFFKLMFGGGSAKLKLAKREVQIANSEEGAENEIAESQEAEEEKSVGIDVELSLPRKKVSSLEVLSGGEKSLVSIAALFALVSVSPPPFLVLDEIDAPLDERNARRFADMLKEFAKKTQFIMVTHNRATMESADILYGVTLGEDGASKILSLKLEV